MLNDALNDGKCDQIFAEVGNFFQKKSPKTSKRPKNIKAFFKPKTIETKIKIFETSKYLPQK